MGWKIRRWWTAGKYDEAAKLMRENPQAILIPLANKAERDVQKLRREKRELIAKDAGREAVRAKEEQITAVMMRLNEAASRREAVKRQPSSEGFFVSGSGQPAARQIGWGDLSRLAAPDNLVKRG